MAEWVKQKPSIEGWYWMRESDHHRPVVVHVTFDSPHLYRMVYRMHAVGLPLDDEQLSRANWSGPLCPPGPRRSHLFADPHSPVTLAMLLAIQKTPNGPINTTVPIGDLREFCEDFLDALSGARVTTRAAVGTCVARKEQPK
jgi:hypothetical protein